MATSSDEKTRSSDRTEGKENEVSLEDRVRGTNVNTGGPVGMVERVASDETLAHLALALRSMPVGSFQSLNGDHRTVEASCRAAEDLRVLFNDHGIDFTVFDKEAARTKTEGATAETDEELTDTHVPTISQGSTPTATSGRSSDKNK